MMAAIEGRWKVDLAVALLWQIGLYTCGTVQQTRDKKRGTFPVLGRNPLGQRGGF